MRQAAAAALIGVSILAHGFWRAGSRLHHLFGALTVLLAAPIACAGSIRRRAGAGPQDDGQGDG